nr:hypothetical protein [Tanacetum cinerariifolium]
MSTQQDIYAVGSENRPHMLNNDNYVSWSSCVLRYANSRPNGKLIYNSIMNGPYVRRMIPEPGDPNREVPVPETFHEQTDDELTEAEIKQMEADDQAIQTILLGLPKDIYAAQMMKGSDIGIQEKKAKLFNEWERNGNVVAVRAEGNAIGNNVNQYTELLELIPEPHQEQQNDSNVTSVVYNVEQGGGTVEKHPKNVEEKRALYD